MIDALAQRLRGDIAGRGRGSRRTRRRLSLPRLRVLLVVTIVVALLGLAWLWVRDSALVVVKRVSVSGLSGPDAAAVRAALVLAAHDMTTLDVKMDQLRTAVAPFPVVKELRVNVQFPHAMEIRVVEQIPVGVVLVGGRRTAVAGDGTLLHDVAAPQSLPVIPLHVPPGGARLTEHDALGAAELLAAAPYGVLLRVSQVASIAPHGLVAQLRSGPSIYFGDATRPAAKWAAAAAVLADTGSAGAVYVDVTDPNRPAAGGATANPASGNGGAATGNATGNGGGSQTTSGGG